VKQKIQDKRAFLPINMPDFRWQAAGRTAAPLSDYNIQKESTPHSSLRGGMQVKWKLSSC
jgi:hypothetical protein